MVAGACGFAKQRKYAQPRDIVRFFVVRFNCKNYTNRPSAGCNRFLKQLEGTSRNAVWTIGDLELHLPARIQANLDALR